MGQDKFAETLQVSGFKGLVKSGSHTLYCNVLINLKLAHPPSPGHTPSIWPSPLPGEGVIWRTATYWGWGIWPQYQRGGEFYSSPRFYVSCHIAHKKSPVNSDKRHGLETATRGLRNGDKRQCCWEFPTAKLIRDEPTANSVFSPDSDTHSAREETFPSVVLLFA